MSTLDSYDLFTFASVQSTVVCRLKDELTVLTAAVYIIERSTERNYCYFFKAD